MPIAWQGIASVGGDLPDDDRQQLREYLDAVGDEIETQLSAVGLAKFASPLFRPFNLVAARNPDGSYSVVFAEAAAGMAAYRYLVVPGGELRVDGLVAQVQRELGWNVTSALAVPDLDRRRVRSVAKSHVETLLTQVARAEIKETRSMQHIATQIDGFLEDHPDPANCVFVMMPFDEGGHVDEAFEVVKGTASAFGLVALRADDKAYSDHLWPNVETYMACCRYGVAIFEDLDDREFNPNVSIELGYMIGLGKRCLLLKEQRLEKMPADLVGHLYKPWDAFNVEETVAKEVRKWFMSDLGLSEI